MGSPVSPRSEYERNGVFFSYTIDPVEGRASWSPGENAV